MRHDIPGTDADGLDFILSWGGGARVLPSDNSRLIRGMSPDFVDLMSRSIGRLSQMGFTTSARGGNTTVTTVNGSSLTRKKGEDVGLLDIIRRLH